MNVKYGDMNEFFDSTNKYEIKIFQVDRTFYEFRDLHSIQDVLREVLERTTAESICTIGKR